MRGNPSLSLERVRGMPGLHMLRLTLDVQIRLPQGTPGAVPGTVTGCLWIGTGPNRGLLGHGHALLPIYFNPANNPSSMELHFDVHPEQVAALEDSRDGRDLEIRLDHRVAFPAHTDDQWADWWGQSQFRVAATHWAEVLAQFQLAESVLLLVPAPSEAATDEVRRSFQR